MIINIKSLNKSVLLVFSLLLIQSNFFSQNREWNSSQIFHEISKLKNTGSVLYLAAHPDDENTRLISWLANEAKVRTAYLSLTRGDGGQNLIGTEKGALLGTLRTQELLEARKIDGGEQFFTRAVDFGYSKSADESFEKWGKKEILADVVFAIRKFQPDIIITRFPPNRKAGHGHHEASALLAEEAFEAAADPSAFPSQLEFVQTWQTKTLLHNSGTWFLKNLEKIAKESNDYLKIDVGTYSPILGESYNTIASKARSQHRCQGFGSILDRGEHFEYLKYVAGEKPEKEIFENIDLSWSGLNSKADIDAGVSYILENFNFQDPSFSIPSLVALYEFIDQLPNQRAIVSYKKEKVLEIISACAGLWIEALASEEFACRSENVNVKIEALQRSSFPIIMESAYFNSRDSLLNKKLSNKKRSFPIQFEIGSNASYSNPFWLNKKFVNRYQVDNPVIRNFPEKESSHKVWFNLKLDLKEKPFYFKIARNIQYKWEDKANGEQYENFNIHPELSISAIDKNVLCTNSESKLVRVKLSAHKGSQLGVLYPQLDSGWVISPQSIPFDLKEKGDEVILNFQIVPPKRSEASSLSFQAKTASGFYTKELFEINYSHIRNQSVLLDSKVQLANIQFQKKKNNIGYIPGSGDEIPLALEAMGYKVTLIPSEEILVSDLSDFETIIVGIRAYNTQDALIGANKKLMQYIMDGGNLIVQYNTNRNLLVDEIGPYPFNLSSKRVTDENSRISYDSSSTLLNYPNLLGEEDFENWVQERGLYFADSWDNSYSTLFKMSDKEEEALSGSVLYCDYGKGTFIYSGISFFRQLPAGIPGAYRLFANFIEYRQNSFKK